MDLARDDNRYRFDGMVVDSPTAYKPGLVVKTAVGWIEKEG